MNIGNSWNVDNITDFIIVLEECSSIHSKIIQLMYNEKFKKFSQTDINKIIHYSSTINIIIHSSYIINIADEYNNYSLWINELINEINFTSSINSKFIVVHMGKQMKKTKANAINNMYMGLIYIYERIKNKNIKILLEMPAGQGTEMCSKIEDFAYFFNKLKNSSKEIKKYFGFCLDTCHLFASGYDLTTKMKINMFFEIVNELIGLKYFNLIHLNDSYYEIASQTDRHQEFGKGTIGLDNILYFAKIAHKLNVPIITETGNLNDTKMLIDLFTLKN